MTGHGRGAHAEIDVVADALKTPMTIADEMKSFIARVTTEFGFPGAKPRATAQRCMLLFNRSFDEGRSEILITKIFVLLCGHMHKSHAGCMFQMENGSWERREGVSTGALELVMETCRFAQSVFLTLARKEVQPERPWSSVAEEVSHVLTYLPDEYLVETYLIDITSKTAKAKASKWYLGCSDLCKSIIKQFSEHSVSLAVNFHRWGGSNLEMDYRCFDFTDCTWAVLGGVGQQAPKVCWQ